MAPSQHPPWSADKEIALHQSCQGYAGEGELLFLFDGPPGDPGRSKISLSLYFALAWCWAPVKALGAVAGVMTTESPLTKRIHLTLGLSSVCISISIRKESGLKEGGVELSIRSVGPSTSCGGHGLLPAQEHGGCPGSGHQEGLPPETSPHPSPLVVADLAAGTSWPHHTHLSLNIMFFRVLVLAVVFGRFPSLPLAAMTYW